MGSYSGPYEPTALPRFCRAALDAINLLNVSCDLRVFDVMAFGRFAPDRLRTGFDPAPRTTTPAIEEMIAAEWDRRVDEARGRNVLLFNGALYRYVAHRLDGTGAEATLELVVGNTCYRDFVGTNLHNHHRLAEFPWNCFANPIGTTATLMTTDGRIVYGRRSERVAYHASHVHTFGGALEPSDRDNDGHIDAFGSVIRELNEELGLIPEDIREIVAVGLVRDREIRQPELLFEAHVLLSFAELNARWNNAKARDEHVELVALPAQPDAVVPFIRSCGPIAPVAVAGLLLFGRCRWGERWYDSAMAS